MGKTLTDLQIFGCELHENALGGRQGWKNHDLKKNQIRFFYLNQIFLFLCTSKEYKGMTDSTNAI